MKKKLYNLWINEKRWEQMETLSKELDMPVSILIRMGMTLILQKYKKQLIMAFENDTNK